MREEWTPGWSGQASGQEANPDPRISFSRIVAHCTRALPPFRTAPVNDASHGVDVLAPGSSEPGLLRGLFHIVSALLSTTQPFSASWTSRWKWWIAYSFSPLGASPDMIGPWSYPFDLSPRCTLSHSAMSSGASTLAV